MNTNKIVSLCLICVHLRSSAANSSSSKSVPGSDRGASTLPPPDPPEPALQNSVPPHLPGGPAPSGASPTQPQKPHSAAPRPPRPRPLRPCQHPRPILRHRDAVLEVRRVRAVL